MRRALATLGIKRAPGFFNVYATHLPVLIGLSRLFKFERVVEFGCGQYSTLTFLDREVFTNLKTLHSYETESEWAERVAEMAGNDARLSITSVAGAMASVIEGVRFDDYDLVFVDDSATYEERARTIRAIAGQCSAATLIVIHDYESPLYQTAAATFRHRFAFDALTPHTGLVWNERPVDEAALRELNSVIKRHSKRVKPDDLNGWKRRLERFKPHSTK